MGEGVGVKLASLSKQGDALVVMQHGKGMQDRVARHVGATDVQQPADRVGQGQDGGLLTLQNEGFGQPRAFGLQRFTGEVIGMDEDPAHGGQRLVGPDGIHKVGGGLQDDAAAREGGLNPSDFIGGVQPRVIADHAGVEMFRDPRAGLGFWPRDGGKDRQIDLRFDLCAVAPVDENARDVVQHDAEPGRSGEPGQPLQPVIAVGDIFALMGVRAGNEEAGKARPKHGRAQVCQPPGALGGRCH